MITKTIKLNRGESVNLSTGEVTSHQVDQDRAIRAGIVAGMKRNDPNAFAKAVHESYLRRN